MGIQDRDAKSWMLKKDLERIIPFEAQALVPCSLTKHLWYWPFMDVPGTFITISAVLGTLKPLSAAFSALKGLKSTLNLL